MKKDTTLKSIMTTNLTVVKVDTPFLQIKKVFEENKFHHLPVLNKNKTVQGIISRNDFTTVLYSLNKETSGSFYSQKIFEHLTAQDFMTTNPVTLNSDDEISSAADLFLENVYHALPIVEDEQLVGIVTTHDLLGWAFC